MFRPASAQFPTRRCRSRVISAPSSTVTTNGEFSTARRIVSVSSGLMNRALITPTSSPSSRSCGGRFQAIAQQRAAGDQHSITAPVDHFRAAQFQRRASALDRFYRRLRITIDAGPSCSSAKSSIAAQIVSSPGAMTIRFGKQPHVADVERTVMRRSVGTGQPGPIEHERDRQILQRHFLKNLIEAALQKRAVNIDDRPHAGFGLPGRERHRVRFANAGVEEPIAETPRGSVRACFPGT